MTTHHTKHDGAFTLVELLVVIVVIAILAALVLPAIANARRKANWVTCSSNLHQFSLAWMDYRYENNNRTPAWLSTLYPKFCSSKEIYVCASDADDGLNDGSKPADLVANLSSAFDETDDNKGRNGIDACSYFYEMSSTNCSYNPGASWAQTKMGELPLAHPTTFPVIRCFHHWKDKRYDVVTKDSPPKTRIDGMTINVAYAGNIFFGPENWNYASCTEL